MALQFLIGGCSSGKTTELIRQTLSYAQDNPDRTVFMIVPEQYTVQTQRALVMASSHAGILNIDVVSFARLAHRIFEEQGQMNRVILDDVGKSLLLQRVVQKVEDHLTVLKRGIRRPGYISEVKSVLSEFMQYGIDEDDLAFLQTRTDADGHFLSAKLKDLQILFKAFRQGLGERYLTKEEMLLVLADCVSQSDILKDSVIAFDGFTGFTPVQITVIRELMKVCSQMMVTITMDPKLDPFDDSNPYELFGMSRRMAAKLRRVAREESFPVEKPVLLDEEKVNRNETISFLETNMFRDELANICQGGLTGRLEVYSGSDPHSEVMLAAKKAAQLLRDHEWHYRDIAIVVSDMEQYAAQIQDVFARYHLPVFLDYRHSVMENAFVEYVRSLLDIELNDYTKTSVMRFLRTGFSDMTLEEIDLLENDVTARGVRGYSSWTAPTEDEKAEELRARLMKRLEHFHGAVRGEMLTVNEYCRAVYEFLEEDDAVTFLKAAASYAAGRGDGPALKEYEQIYEALIRLFDQFTELIGDQKVSFKEYAQLLDAGLSEIRIGVLPAGRDDILVGDMTRTRIPQVKALLMIGAGTSLLPGNLGQTGLLSRWDREVFFDEQYELSPGPKEKTWSQRFYLYQHVVRPSEYLCVTYARTDAEGKPDEPSYLIRELAKLMPDLNAVDVQQFMDNPAGVSPEYAIDYVAASLQNIRHTSQSPDSQRRRKFFESLWTWFEETGRFKKAFTRIRQAGDYRRIPARLTGDVLPALYPADLKRSISQLQTYAQCPYKHFLTYGLHLRPRPVFEFKMSDFGSAFHAALEAYGKHTQEEHVKWQEVPVRLRAQWIDEAVEKGIRAYGFDVLTSSARETYGIERMKRLVARSIDVLTKQLEAGEFSPYDYEMDFGTGVIDRLDIMTDDDHVYVKVIDYKTGTQSFDPVREYYGLQIQLPLYMYEAMKRIGEKTGKEPVPAAMFYYQADDPYVDAVPGKDPDEEILKKLKVNGALQDDPVVLEGLDKDLPSSSSVAPFGMNQKEKRVNKRSTAVCSATDMETMVTYARHIADRQDKKIADGLIEVSPYKLDQEGGCKYCDYRNICRFDPKIERYRELSKMKRDEVLEKMRQEMEA